jgi:hypothetical protein
VDLDPPGDFVLGRRLPHFFKSSIVIEVIQVFFGLTATVMASKAMGSSNRQRRSSDRGPFLL